MAKKSFLLTLIIIISLMTTSSLSFANENISEEPIIDLRLLETTDIKWKVIKGSSHVRPIAAENGKPLVKRDKGLYNIIKSEHEETVDFIEKLGL